MGRESREIATIAGLAVVRVAGGDPRSRWGSCTHDGDLRYSWRLVMAPDHVRRATVAHEVAHLRHMDHGAAFHALVDELHDGDVAAARGWLRREGRALHRYRFTACAARFGTPGRWRTAIARQAGAGSRDRKS